MGVRKSDHYLTPQRVYDLIHDVWGYTTDDMYDPCPYYSKKEDGLTKSWQHLNYVNPPYSLLVEFVEKAMSEARHGRISIMLLPCKTDQKWFHDYILYHKFQAKFVPFRIRFANAKWNAKETHFLVMIDFKTAGKSLESIRTERLTTSIKYFDVLPMRN